MKNKLKDVEEDLGLIEDMLGYDFQDDSLLIQAFKTKAYDKHYGSEALEFVGESALSFYLTKMMVDTFGYIEDVHNDFNVVFGLVEYDTKRKMLNLRNNLTHKSLLAYRIEVLGLHKYLLMSKDEIKSFKNEEQSYQTNLFYSLIGAVTVDSEYNEDLIEETIANLLNFDYYLINGFRNSELDYVTLVLNWDLKTNEEVPFYEYEEKEETVLSQLILHTSFGDEIIKGEGYTASGARRNCAQNAYQFLEKHDLLD